jgi:hypothetical protein
MMILSLFTFFMFAVATGASPALLRGTVPRRHLPGDLLAENNNAEQQGLLNVTTAFQSWNATSWMHINETVLSIVNDGQDDDTEKESFGIPISFWIAMTGMVVLVMVCCCCRTRYRHRKPKTQQQERQENAPVPKAVRDVAI